MRSRGMLGSQPVAARIFEGSPTRSRDIEDLLPQLEPRAEELAALAIEKLRNRGEREEKDLRETLER